jgi:enoyl-CoA hydratase
VRLPRLIGHSRALDLILTGRPVGGEEALGMGLANRVAEPGRALHDALDLAAQLAVFPQNCVRTDRLSSYQQWGLSLDDALAAEHGLGIETLRTGEAAEGAARFVDGVGRHGDFS